MFRAGLEVLADLEVPAIAGSIGLRVAIVWRHWFITVAYKSRKSIRC